MQKALGHCPKVCPWPRTSAALGITSIIGATKVEPVDESPGCWPGVSQSVRYNQKLWL